MGAALRGAPRGATVRTRSRTAGAPPAIDDGADRFELVTDLGRIRCRSLVIATGGLAVPKLGATPFGYRLAEQFGLRIVAPRPGLVPLALAPETLVDAGADLGGLVRGRDVSGAIARRAPRGGRRAVDSPAMRGSGRRCWSPIAGFGARDPADLELLAAAGGRPQRGVTTRRRPSISCPGDDAAAWLAQQSRSRALLSTLLAQRLPRSFAQGWCALHGGDRPARGADRHGARAHRRGAARLGDRPVGNPRLRQGRGHARRRRHRRTVVEDDGSRGGCPASSSSAKSSTSPAGWAVTTSSGRGRRGGWPGNAREGGRAQGARPGGRPQRPPAPRGRRAASMSRYFQ